MTSEQFETLLATGMLSIGGLVVLELIGFVLMFRLVYLIGPRLFTVSCPVQIPGVVRGRTVRTERACLRFLENGECLARRRIGRFGTPFFVKIRICRSPLTATAEGRVPLASTTLFGAAMLLSVIPAVRGPTREQIMNGFLGAAVIAGLFVIGPIIYERWAALRLVENLPDILREGAVQQALAADAE